VFLLNLNLNYIITKGISEFKANAKTISKNRNQNKSEAYKR